MLKGNVPILATAFTEQGELDLASVERLVHFLLQQGVDGLALFGNASEGYALTQDEKQIVSALGQLARNCPREWLLVLLKVGFRARLPGRILLRTIH